MEQFSLTDIKKKNLSDVYHYIYMNPSLLQTGYRNCIISQSAYRFTTSDNT